MQYYEIALTQGKVTLVDLEDFTLLSQFKWHLSNVGYACRSYKNKKCYMHRLITNAPDGMDVDHINGNKLDNRRSNLRVVTRSQNMANLKSARSKSGYKGVVWNAALKKWQAQIKVNYKNHSLGYFITAIEAANAYDAAALAHFGNCASLNSNRKVS